jgi:hypothetical protein
VVPRLSFLEGVIDSQRLEFRRSFLEKKVPPRSSAGDPRAPDERSDGSAGRELAILNR